MKNYKVILAIPVLLIISFGLFFLLPGQSSKSFMDWPDPPTSVGFKVIPKTVLIATPIKNSAKHLPMYFKRLDHLKYPKKYTSLAFLVSDSNDKTLGVLKSLLSRRGHLYHSVTVMEKDFKYELDAGEMRHDLSHQVARRTILSKSRNFLIQSALKNEEWVLWIDVDVREIPLTVVQDMTRYNKDILAANCFIRTHWNFGVHHYDLNSVNLIDLVG